MAAHKFSLQTGKGTDSLELEFWFHPSSQRLGCGSGLQFPVTEGGHEVCSAAGAVETALLCIVSISAHLCSFQTRKGHRDPRETHFPPSLNSFCLAHAFVAILCLPKAGTNTGVWQGSEPWRVGWERGILGPQPGDRALLHVHCQIFQLRFCCSSHAEGTVLGLGSTPGCWAVNPAGDAWKGGGNSWSRTQSYVNPCMLLQLSFISREKRRSQRCPERLFPKNDSSGAGEGRRRPCKARLSLLWLNRAGFADSSSSETAGRDPVTQGQLGGSWQLLLFQCQALDFSWCSGEKGWQPGSEAGQTRGCCLPVRRMLWDNSRA